METATNPNKEIFDRMTGKSLVQVMYSNDRYADDYVTLVLSDGSSVTLHAMAPNMKDITWIKAELKES